MATLKTLEVNIIQSIKELAGVYQVYEENFEDEKLAEIKNGFVVPMLQKAGALMDVFEDIEKVMKSLEDRGVITEEG